MNSFWQFPSSCKYDQLDEKAHAHLICGALADPDTGIDFIEGAYILYGPDEALLFRPKSFAICIPIELLRIFLSKLKPVAHDHG